MNKTLLILAGAALLAVPSVHAQSHGRDAVFASRSAFNSHRSGFYHGSGYYHGHGYYGRGRYYYLGGIPYFYPFYDYGFGYPYYYGSGLGYGYATPYYGGYYGDVGPGFDAYGAPPYDARIVDQSTPGRSTGGAPSLPTAVQRQLAQRGYYKGSVDGKFGDASRTALRNFQRDKHLKETGLIDGPTLQALGFSDRR